MADIRSLLKNERAARRISHPHATYSTTGTLVCLVCHIQLKSESLWNGHLRSAQHAMRLQRIRDGTLGRPPGAPDPRADEVTEEGAVATDSLVDGLNGQTNELSAPRSKKRKAGDDEDEEAARKRNKSGVPDGFFDAGVASEAKTPPLPSKESPPGIGQETKLPSRPATPLITPPISAPPSKLPAVDEDEWAAFEADIAAADIPLAEDAVISAPAMSAEEIAAKSREEESSQRKERQEAEMEGDKEDAARKLEDEFDEMEELEGRIRKLKEKREALRLKEGAKPAVRAPEPAEVASIVETGVDEEDEEDDDEDDDDWDGFRLRA